jgi:hypothetical protein
MSGTLTLAEAAVCLGIEGSEPARRALRRLQSLEKAAGVSLLGKAGEGRRSRYVVFARALASVLPAPASPPAPAAATLHEMQARIEEMERMLARLTSVVASDVDEAPVSRLEVPTRAA